MTDAAEVWLREVEIRGDEFPPQDVHPFNVELLRSRQKLTFNQSVSFLVGENGSGKSTFIEAVARRCGLHIWTESKRRPAPPARGRGVPDASHQAGLATIPSAEWTPGPGTLGDYVRVTLEKSPVRGGIFNAESFRDWAEFLDDVSQIDPGHAKYHGGQGLTLRSHGEGLLVYFEGRYRIPGLYFLDEPEAALSPSSQLHLLRLLAGFRSSGHAQFIIATHSPILMALPGAQVFDFAGSGIRETSYEETSYYKLYRDFMADPSAFLEDDTQP